MKRYQAILGAIALFLSAWTALKMQIIAPTFASTHEDVVNALPFYALIVFGCYALANIGSSLMVFGDCPDAAQELLNEIEVAKADLRKKNVDVTN